jgi:HEAT repeat protein
VALSLKADNTVEHAVALNADTYLCSLKYENFEQAHVYHKEIREDDQLTRHRVIVAFNTETPSLFLVTFSGSFGIANKRIEFVNQIVQGADRFLTDVRRFVERHPESGVQDICDFARSQIDDPKALSLVKSYLDSPKTALRVLCDSIITRVPAWRGPQTSEEMPQFKSVLDVLGALNTPLFKTPH